MWDVISVKSVFPATKMQELSSISVKTVLLVVVLLATGKPVVI